MFCTFAAIWYLILFIPFWTWRCLTPTWCIFSLFGALWANFCSQSGLSDLHPKDWIYFLNDSLGSYSISDHMFMDSVPNGSLKWSSSCLVISMVGPTWCHDRLEGTLFWVNADERISEYAQFNLVIRLRIVKQSALLFFSLFASRWPCRPGEPSDHFNSAPVRLHGTAANYFFNSCLHW